MLTLSRFGLAALASLASLGFGLPVATAQAGAGPLRVLMLSGMNNHDWQQTTPALERIYEDSGRFAVEVTEDPSSCDAAALAKYDLVVSNWTNYPSEDRAWGAEAEQALLDFVRGGKGFALFHAAAACLWPWPEYRELTGAWWAMGETGHGRIHTFGVAMAARDHPITRGLESFAIHDELWHRIGISPTARVLCTAFSAAEEGGTGNDEPVALVTEYGKGRCFNLVLGHDVTAMETDGWRLLMLRGSEWAATGAVTIDVPVDIGLALDAVAGYRRHESRHKVAAVERLVQRAAGDRRLRDSLAAEMLERLGSDATDDGKAFLLQQLSLIGGAREVPPVAALLDHESLGPYAVGALERIPGPEASAALRDALDRLEGEALVRAISALGEKRDTKAEAALARRLADEDDAVARAAIDALGKIGGASAIDTLLRFWGDAPPQHGPAIADALLRCADGLAAGGKPERARPVYARLVDADLLGHVRTAAFVGVVSCGGDERAELVLEALAGEDSALQAGAVRCVRALGDGGLAKAVAGQLQGFDPPVQVQVIDALRDSGAEVAAPAVADLVASGDAGVRLAAVRALGRLGDVPAYPPLLEALRGNPAEGERREIESALAGVCARSLEADGALPFTLTHVSAEDALTRASLLRVLGMLGDEQSLAMLRTSLTDASSDTRMAAIGALSQWPDGAPMADLLIAARAADDAAEKAAALTAIAALAPKALDEPEQTVAILSEAMALTADANEKRAILGSLGLIHHPTALQLAARSFDDGAVVREACLAAVQIAESLPAEHKAGIRAALERVLEVTVGNEAIQTRAKSVLRALGIPVDVTESVALENPGPNLALGATASSPDGIEKDGAAGGDQAAIDGDPATYWDEADNHDVYRLTVAFDAPHEVSALRITGYQQHNYAPKDFEIICDGATVKAVKDAWYESNQFAATFPATRCTSIELKITGRYGASPAIRELEVFGAAASGK
jgi:type 1 glutamine amidotransferase/HEAT repeat protein